MKHPGAPPARKKPKAISPTQRTLALCRKHGWTVQVVEHWNQYAKIRVDLFGCLDLLAMNGKQIIAIQSTTGDNMAARLKKIKAEPRALLWVQSGGRLFVHGWRKLVASGKWECRELEVTKSMLTSVSDEVVE